MQANKKQEESSLFNLTTNSITTFREETRNLFKKNDNNNIFYLIYHNKSQEIIKKIKLKTFNPNQRLEHESVYLWTPLYMCVKLQHIEIAQTLLEHGADINCIIHDYSECCGTALDLAILRNDTVMESIIRQFIKEEDININTGFKSIRTKLRNKNQKNSFNFKSNNT